jgi:uncharacterized protein
MSYRIQRTLAREILAMTAAFKVLLVTGPRQVGKTTLLEAIGGDTRSYVSLDNLSQRAAAIQDPAGFIERLELPVIIDEVQYAPNLFPYIKLAVDGSSERGQFWLTGSQQFEMMQHVTESLAGRVGLLELLGISLAEEQNRESSVSFLPELSVLKSRQKIAKSVSMKQMFHTIWRGSYPDIVSSDGYKWERFFDSYISTYLQRDIQEYLGVKNKANFLKFLRVAAARTGQLINYADMAADVGVSQLTIKSWLHALEASGIVRLLQPYHTNMAKRLLKTPKLYFLDTGLCSYLCGWLDADVLERGAMNGAMLETYVVSEIIKSYVHHGRTPRLFFYRDKDKNEIDLLIEENGVVYPIEIKKTASPNASDCKSFVKLRKMQMPVGHGCVLCFVSTLIPLAEGVDAVPIWYI